MFFKELQSFGDRVALVLPGGRSVGYSELADLADRFGASLGDRRSVLLIEAANRVEMIVAYLGALRAGWPVFLTEMNDGVVAIEERFDIGMRYVRRSPEEWVLEPTGVRPAVPHEDLALLLSTSGSTGSPKLVRLSLRAIDANARSIGEYLGISDGTRAITSLPLSYSYGLSVLNSHLAAGASVVVTEATVLSDEFWVEFRAQAVTSIAGVPYSYDIFERIGLRNDPPPSLRTMTQAGGRLSAEMVGTYVRWASARGIRMFVMYGQTEATARMAYLPPERANDYPDCIGVAIPGGSFRLAAEDGSTIDGVNEPGELVYSGPNVMMGYAYGAEDLARGHELDELRTGDLAERTTDGLFRIVGRLSRFSKIGGKRIGLDDVEAMLARMGVRATVAGDDELVAVWMEDGARDPDDVRRSLADAMAVPPSALAMLSGPAVPRLASGKPDYRAILAAGKAATKQTTFSTPSLGKALATTIGRRDAGPEQSFETLGGDSLAYVQASIVIEEHLGFLPDNWERIPVAELEALARSPAQRDHSTRQVSSEAFARAAASLAVVAGHTPSGAVAKGGALILFLLAGYSLARFQRNRLVEGRGWSVVGDLLRRVILPYYLLMFVICALSKDADLSAPTLLLVSNIAGESRGPLMPYWFPEALLQCVLIVAVLCAVPAIRSVVRSRPVAAAVLFFVGSLLVLWLTPLIWRATPVAGWPRSPDQWLWVFAAGWALYVVPSTAGRLSIAAVAVALVAVIYGLNTSRAYALAAALGLIILVPTLRLPRLASRAIAVIASASFFIYLVHMLVIQIVGYKLGLTSWWLTVIVATLAGIAAQYGWQRVELLASRLLAGRREKDDPVLSVQGTG